LNNLIETLLFSENIVKINHYDISQERNIILTNKAIYNFKKTNLKRRIDFLSIKGVTISKLTDEFVVHCRDSEHDYDYISPRRKKIIEIIDRQIKLISNISLKLSEINEKSLKNYVTLKTEKKKDPTFSRMSNVNMIDILNFIYGKKEVVEEKKQIIALKEILFVRNKEIKEVSLSDFIILHEIGKGNFSIVELVQHKTTKDYYAMKTFKKSTLLQCEQVETIIFEKKIQQTFEHPFLMSLNFCIQSTDKLYFVLPFVM